MIDTPNADDGSADPRHAAIPELAELQKHVPDATMPAAVGIGAIALGMAIRFNNGDIVTDGALYQQYKIEGRNLQPNSIDRVFDIAIRIEHHLLATSQRIGSFMENVIGEEIARMVSEEVIEPKNAAEEGDAPTEDQP